MSLAPELSDDAKAYSSPMAETEQQNPEEDGTEMREEINDDDDDGVGDYGTEYNGTEQQLEMEGDDDGEEREDEEYDAEDAKTIMEMVDGEMAHLTERERAAGVFSSDEARADFIKAQEIDQTQTIELKNQSNGLTDKDKDGDTEMKDEITLDKEDAPESQEYQVGRVARVMTIIKLDPKAKKPATT